MPESMNKDLLTKVLAGVAVGAITMTVLWNVIDVTGIAGAVSERVNEYCQKPEAERLAIRGEINQRIAPHTIALTCSGAPSQ